MRANRDKKNQIRLKGEIKKDFEAVAEYRGLTPTALTHSFIVKTVHDAKLEIPHVFAKTEKENSKTKARKSLGVSDKSKKEKSIKSSKTITTSDGKTIPLVDEAASFEDDKQ
jgi:antitoxin component of RelBE/YafQ-DinJ toxin-antitoxin module